MRRPVVALLATLVLGTLPSVAQAGVPEDYRYESTSLSSQFRQREGRLRIRGSIEAATYAQTNGESGTFAGISLYFRDRGAGLNLHCWSYKESPATLEIGSSGRSGAVSDGGSLRCHTHSRPSRRARGTVEYAATFVGDHRSSSGRSVYEFEGVRCTDRWTSREGPGTAQVTVAIPTFAVKLSLAFDPTESYIRKSEGSCRARGK
jgi:hypothetical protein